MDGLPVASGATAEINGTVYWSDGESYKRVSVWSYGLQLTILFTGLAASVLALMLFPCALFFRFFPRRKATERLTVSSPLALTPLTYFAVAGTAFLCLLVGFVFFQLGDLSAVASLGQLSIPSLTLFIVSFLGPISTISGLAILWPKRRNLVPKVISLVLGLPMVSLTVLLVIYGVVPLAGWIN